MDQVTRWGSVAVLLGAQAALLGCRSIESRYVDPQQLRHGQEVGGAPIVVERPRWLKVTHYVEQYAIVMDSTKIENEVRTTEPKVVTLNAKEQPLLRKRIETEILTMGEVYALDVLRPFSGNSEHSITTHGTGGQLKEVKAKTEDNTLNTVLTNLDKIKGFVGASGVTAPEADPSVRTVTLAAEVARIELYDLYDLAKGIVRAVWVQEAGGPAQCGPPCPPAAGPCCPPPPCPPPCPPPPPAPRRR